MKLIKFYADWCGPCKMLSQTLAEMEIRLPLVEVDIEHDRDVAMTYGVRSIPMMVLVDENDNVLRKLTGAQTKANIQEFLGEYA